MRKHTFIREQQHIHIWMGTLQVLDLLDFQLLCTRGGGYFLWPHNFYHVPSKQSALPGKHILLVRSKFFLFRADAVSEGKPNNVERVVAIKIIYVPQPFQPGRQNQITVRIVWIQMRRLIICRLIRIYTGCQYLLLLFLTKTPVCIGGLVQIQWWKSPFQKFMDRRVNVCDLNS